MTEVDFQEHIALYALGSLEPKEAAQVELYLKNNPSAQATYLWYLESVTLLAQAVPSQIPNLSVKIALKRRIKSFNQHQTTFLPTWWMGIFGRRLEFAPLFSVGLLLVALGLFFYNVQQQQTIASINLEIRQFERFIASDQTLSFKLQAANSTTVVGKVLVSQQKEVLMSHEMGILPSQKTWQAWYFKAGVAQPISLGTTSNSYLLIQLPEGATTLALSEEPLGGSIQPTIVRAVAQISL